MTGSVKHWSEVKELKFIKALAHSYSIPDGLFLGALLTYTAARIPCGYLLPAVVGYPSPISLFICLVGDSGLGKSSAIKLANKISFQGDGIPLAAIKDGGHKPIICKNPKSPEYILMDFYDKIKGKDAYKRKVKREMLVFRDELDGFLETVDSKHDPFPYCGSCGRAILQEQGLYRRFTERLKKAPTPARSFPGGSRGLWPS